MHDTIDAPASLRYGTYVKDVEGQLLFANPRSEIGVPDAVTARQFADHIMPQASRTTSDEYGTQWLARTVRHRLLVVTEAPLVKAAAHGC